MNQEITFLTLFARLFGGTLRRHVRWIEQRIRFAAAAILNRIRLIVLLNLGRISSYVVIGLLVGLVGAGRHFLGRHARGSKRFVYCRQCFAAFARSAVCRYFDCRNQNRRHR